MENKTLSAEIEKGARDGQWVMGAVTRDLVDDTMDDAVFPNALKLIKNRLISLWQHNYDQPIGYWENLHYKNGQLIGDLKLATTNLAKMVKQLLLDDVPLGASIGFQPIAYTDNKHGGYHFKEIKLLETSIVSVPANPAAIQIAKSWGIEQAELEGDQSAIPLKLMSEREKELKAIKERIEKSNRILTRFKR